MSYENRIDAAFAAVDEHNKALGEGHPGRVNWTQFLQGIQMLGGTNEKRLSDLSHEDILTCLPGIPAPSGEPIKPRVLAKDLASIFRANNKAPEEKRPVSSKKVERMTLAELVEAFDAEDHTSPVSKRLAEICKDQPFIVFSTGRIVDVETTLKLLTEIKQGYEGLRKVEVNGIIKPVYKLGELPDNFADENPLYKGRPLRPDGTCDQTGRSWEGVSNEIRQFVRTAVDQGEFKVTLDNAHTLLDLIMQPDAMNKLRRRYQNTSVAFDALQSQGKLPVLKIPLGLDPAQPGFPKGKQVVWTRNMQNSYTAVSAEQVIADHYARKGKIVVRKWTDGDATVRW